MTEKSLDLCERLLISKRVSSIMKTVDVDDATSGLFQKKDMGTSRGTFKQGRGSLLCYIIFLPNLQY